MAIGVCGFVSVLTGEVAGSGGGTDGFSVVGERARLLASAVVDLFENEKKALRVNYVPGGIQGIKRDAPCSRGVTGC